MGVLETVKNSVQNMFSTREIQPVENTKSDAVQTELLEHLLGKKNLLTVDDVKGIPLVMTALDFISNAVALSPIHLYQEKDGEIITIDDDRYFLLNTDTGDTLTPYEFKQAIVMDYYLFGGAWVYIKRYRNKVRGLYYVPFEEVAVYENKNDPIEKDYQIMVRGKKYEPYEFMRILRHTKNGYAGQSILTEHLELLNTAYNTLQYEKKIVQAGGSKKGFIQSERKLSQQAIEALKSAWDEMYTKNTTGVVVLNEGLKFQEASSTSVEMQLNQNKESNRHDIANVFNVPLEVLKGTVTDQVYNNALKTAVVPIVSAIESSMKRDLLLMKEQKQNYYFDFDLTELIRGDVTTRYQAYTEAVKAGWITPNEIRKRENLSKVDGMDVLLMSLGQVVYDIENGVYFTPNTKESTTLESNVSIENKKIEIEEDSRKEVETEDDKDGDTEQSDED